VKRLPVFVEIRLLSFMVCAVVVALSFAHLDVPIALHFWGVGRSLAGLVRGRISRFGATLAVASLASICTYGINSGVLKPFLGFRSLLK